jgi:hypothetical protein
MRRLAMSLAVLVAVGAPPAAGAAATAGARAGAAPATAAAAASLHSDFNNDGFTDLAVGVPGESIGTVVNAGTVQVLFGGATGLSGTGSQTFTQNTDGVGSAGEEFDLFGDALAAGDFDNDGFADLAIGAPGESSSILAVGGVNVLYGGPAGLTGIGSQFFTQNTAGVGSTAEEADFFGDALTAGDFDSDGFTDLAVGAPGESIGSLVNAGTVHILFGTAGGLTGSGSQTFSQNNMPTGSAAERNDSFGFTLGAGDFDNDGFDDLGVGVPFEAGIVAAVGAVNVLYGATAGLTTAGGQFFTQNTAGVGSSSAADETFGFALAVGDFDLDGFGDLAVGVPGESGTVVNSGGVNVLFGTAAGLSGSGSQFITQDTGGVGSAAEADDVFGLALAAADFTGDDFADLAIGVPGEASSIPAVGAVNVLPGTAAGLTGAGSQLLTQSSTGVGTGEHDDSFGFSLATGRFNNDVFADLAVGVPFESIGTLVDAGEADALPGSATGITGGGQALSQESAGVAGSAEEFDMFGFALAAAGPQGATVAAVPAHGTASATARLADLAELVQNRGGLR